MPIIDPMISEFTHEAANTRKVLERVPERKFDWKPHPKSMSLCELASHLADLPHWVGGILTTDEFLLEVADFKPFKAASSADLLQAFDQRVNTAKELMHGQSDEKMLQTWRMKVNGKTVIELPRVAVLRAFILSHSIHHRGQLTVYLRMNEVPVPSTYGPSADEQA